MESVIVDAIKKKVRKPIKIVDEPVLINGPDGDAQQMVPLTIATPKDGLKATLHMMMKHTADLHVTVMEIIAEKYGLNVDEMADAVKAHPKWTEMLVNPILHSMSGNIEYKSIEESSVTSDLKKPGRPKMTDEQKAEAKAKREKAKHEIVEPVVNKVKVKVKKAIKISDD